MNDQGPLTVAATIIRDEFSIDVDFRVTGGETLGLTGGIGSGKSSVAALVAGRLRAAEGVVSFGSEIWDQPSTATFVEARPVGFQSQNYLHDLPEELTGTEIVRRSVTSLNPTAGDPDQVARTTLAELGVEDHVVDRLPWTFSGAEAQRVALARALAPRPSVLVLDEPFGALARQARERARRWLADWLAEFPGVALIATTATDDLDILADRTHMLD